jgi:ribosomal-protein-alanine N-acetyltransferase
MEFSVRPPLSSDLEALYQLHSDPRAYEHWPESRIREEWQARAMLDRVLDGWEHEGVSYWIVTDDSSGKMIGLAGVRPRHAGETPYFNLYYRLMPEVWRQGIATAVAKQAIALAHETAPEYPVIARMRASNVPSERTALAAGLTRAGHDSQGRLVFSDRALYPSLLERLP